MSAFSTPVRVKGSYEFPDIEDKRYKSLLLQLLSSTKGGYSLRKFDYGHQSCYASAVVYILIGMLYELPDDEVIKKIKKILVFNNFQTSLLKRIITWNAVDETSLPIRRIEQLNDFFENEIVFLGLMSKGEEGIHRYGMIFHYFIMKRKGDGIYEIYSSYGSSNVAIRQYKTIVSAPRFNAFIEKLMEDKTSPNKLIEDFITKHFLDTEHEIVQKKRPDEFRDIYDKPYPSSEDPRVYKNKPEDVAREIASYQKRPTYLVLFPNMPDVFRNELAAVEVKEARLELNSGTGSAEELEKAKDIAMDMSSKLAAKMLEAADLLREPEFTPKLKRIGELVVEFAKREIEIEDPPEEADAEEPELVEDTVYDLGFVDISDDLLEEFNAEAKEDVKSPSKKKVRAGKRKRTRKSKRKTRRKSRKTQR